MGEEEVRFSGFDSYSSGFRIKCTVQNPKHITTVIQIFRGLDKKKHVNCFAILFTAKLKALLPTLCRMFRFS